MAACLVSPASAVGHWIIIRIIKHCTNSSLASIMYSNFKDTPFGVSFFCRPEPFLAQVFVLFVVLSAYIFYVKEIAAMALR